MKQVLTNIAASTLVMGATLTAIAPDANSVRVAESDERDAAAAADYASEAREALADNNTERAIRFAERAVERMPRSAEYRHLLGRTYLADGRFASAETSFQDALSIDPDLTRTAFNMALAQIAQGDHGVALGELNDLEGRIAASDLGLAFALAGNRSRAIDILQQAARANGGDAKARQNLALTYALDGRWAEARITAAQDISPALVDQRMRDWASYAQPENSWDQVASLLGVDSDGRDPGQPERLALAPIEQDNVMMAAAPATAPVDSFTAPADPVVAIATPVEENVQVASVSAVREVEVPPVIEADPRPVRVAPTVQDSVVEYGAATASNVVAHSAPQDIAFIVEDESGAIDHSASGSVTVPLPPAPVRTTHSAPQPQLVRTGTVAQVAPVQARPASVQQVPATSSVVAQPAVPSSTETIVAQSRAGEYVVQVGAFSVPANVTVAWERAIGRSSFLSRFAPSRAAFDASGRTLQRLSFGGFESRSEAGRMCDELKARNVDCFVRARAGDTPFEFAALNGAGAHEVA